MWPDFWLAEQYEDSQPEAALRRIFGYTEREDRCQIYLLQLNSFVDAVGLSECHNLT